MYIVYVMDISFPKYIVFLSLTIGFVLANSAGPVEMCLSVAFHLGLHFLQRYPFMGFQSKIDQQTGWQISFDIIEP